MPFYAIGIAKGWIQVRSALKQPAAIRSTAILTVPHDTSKYVVSPEKPFGGYVTVKGTKEIPMKVVVFKGGRTVATIQTAIFKGALGTSPREGSLSKLTSEEVKRLREVSAGGMK